MDVRDDSTTGNRGLDEGVELLVSADGELKMARGDALDLQVLAGVPCELQDLGREVLQDRRTEDRRRRTHPIMSLHTLLQEPMNATHWKLPLISPFTILANRPSLSATALPSSTSPSRSSLLSLLSLLCPSSSQSKDMGGVEDRHFSEILK